MTEAKGMFPRTTDSHGHGVDVYCDVVVVGGGIAGTALAAGLARAGISVTVLERQVSYRDRVRGEYVHPWGVVDAQRLGIDDALLSRGGTWIPFAVAYDELVDPTTAKANPLRISDLCPGPPGGLAVGHPQACQAIADAACSAGTRIIRGVGEVAIEAGRAPRVRFELDDLDYELRTRLIVGADGRSSTVRRQLGLTLDSTIPWTAASGLLIEGLDSWSSDTVAVGTEGDLHFIVVPRHGGMCRLYQFFAIEQKTRFSGPNRQQEFLESFRLHCLPGGDDIAAATPAGPVATYPMNDSLVRTPAVPGAVLVGDAAGWNDPIIGEGLSVSLRDARIVVDILTTSDDWTLAAFTEYISERRERMRRLKIAAHLQNELGCVFTEAGRQRRGAVIEALASDPLLAAATALTQFAGPDAAPAEAFHPQNVDRILAMC